MSFGHCPYCSDKISLPEKAAPFARVQCPLCQEEFALSEVLDRLPPRLIVLDAEDSSELATADATAADSTLAADVEPDTSTPEEFKIAPLDPEPKQQPLRPDFAISTGDDSEEEQRPAGKRITLGGGRKKKNPLVEVVKIVLGGVAGITAALFILLWLPGKWQKDPFKIGVKIGEYAPFIVPANFRPGWKDDGPGFDADAADDADFAAAARNYDKSSSANAGVTMGDLPDFSRALEPPSTTTADASAASETVVSREVPPAPASSSATEPEPPNPLSATGISLDASIGIQLDASISAKPASAKPKTSKTPPATPDDSSSDTSEKPAAKKPKGKKEIEPSAKKEIEPSAKKGIEPSAKKEIEPSASNTEALQGAMKTLAASQQELVAADEDGVSAAAVDYYNVLASLGETMPAALAVNNDGTKQALAQLDNALGPQILQEKKYAVALRDLGQKRLAEAKSRTGAAFIGSIQSIEQADGAFITTLKLFSSETVLLVHQEDPRQHFAPNAKVVVVGTLLPHPAEALPALGKDAGPVVLHPHVVVLKE